MHKAKSIQKTTLETLQWFTFFLASSVAIPIVIGSLYQMSIVEISEFMQRTFFVVGVACFLQALIGHRMPIADGPAGIWMSIFSVYAITTVQNGGSFQETLRVLETAMLFTGLFLILFGLLRLSEKIIGIFTPLVTGSFLFLLTLSLSGTFLQGMLGLDSYPNARLDITFISFFVFFFVLGFSLFWKGPLKNYAVIMGIAAGWLLYSLLVDNQGTINHSLHAFQLPELFAWGLPKWDLGAISIAFFTAIILLSNLVGSLGAGSYVIKGEPTFKYEEMNRGSFTLGINQGLSAIFSNVAVVTLASTSGFIELTNQKRKGPFMYAAILLALVAFFPPVVVFISSIPSSVASAALLATFVQLLGIGLKNIASEELNQRRLTILGISFLIAIGLMFMPKDAFQGLPSILQNIVSNGLLVGTILVILLERFWKEQE